MKIGIITFINTINFGASLQAYALQETLNKFGNDAEVIRYVNKEIEEKEKNSSKKNISLKTIYKNLIMGKGIKKKILAFQKFEGDNIVFGDELNNKTVDVVNSKYDLFITGSDQVWNMRITNADWNYALSFVNDDRKKISYAPSFGNDVFPDDKKEVMKKYLERFKAISVREKSGKDLINEICNRDAEVVLDPTLLLNKNDWEKRIKFKPQMNHYILVYFPHNKKKVFDFVYKLKEKTGLPVVYLSISPKIQKEVKTIYDASPDEFLGWINNADYVVTGSFHGTAFSLNLNKQFYYEPSGKESRIGNLVNLTGTENRSIDNNVDCNIEKNINYSEVNQKLDEQRDKSLEWLKNAIEM